MEGGDVVTWQAPMTEGDDEAAAVLIGKLWTNRAIKPKIVIDMMKNLWSLKGRLDANLMDLNEKTFMFRFSDAWDKEKILEGQPWHFEKFVWCFNELMPYEKLSEVPLYHVPLCRAEQNRVPDPVLQTGSGTRF
ncbi:hypothetical protein RND81_06G093500 [Saponaria officinalis]|uniref:DUF4283 domain-containing protein n=1 Tax=Saponaria officinalis TaxID=3572 RepID=A0AAW1K8L2_SAPOF